MNTLQKMQNVSLNLIRVSTLPAKTKSNKASDVNKDTTPRPRPQPPRSSIIAGKTEQVAVWRQGTENCGLV